MSDALTELGGYIAAKRPDCVLEWEVSHGELNLDVTLANIVGLVDVSQERCDLPFLLAR